MKLSFTSPVSSSELLWEGQLLSWHTFTDEQCSRYYLFSQRENCPCLYDDYLLFVAQILHQKQNIITTNPSVLLLIHYLGYRCVK